MRKGFTIIELLLIIALASILAAASAPLYTSFLAKNHLENKTFEVKNTLYKAQSNAIAGRQDLNWGVYFASGQFILFAGDSFAGRNPAFDEIYILPATVSTSGLNEVIFQKPRGIPSMVGTITISSTEGASNTVAVNSEGVAEIN